MSFLITTSWDDGHPCDLKLADLLEQYGIKGTFYVPQRSQRPVLSEDELRTLSKRFELGAHGVDHTALTTLPLDNARQQINDSKHWIEQLTGKACTLFCPPLGRFHACHTVMLAQAGFRAFRTVELGSLQRPQKAGGIHSIATTVQAYPHTKRTLLLNSLRRFKLARALTAALQREPRDWSESTNQWLVRADQLGGVFHLWGHSWEIDQLGWWPQLERVLQRCRQCLDQGQARTVPNSELVNDC